MNHILIFIFIIIASLSTQAETILIPDDAPSLQEAVELAVSGDVIQITTPEFYWTKVEKREEYSGLIGDSHGVVIKNKDLTIKGLDSLSKTSEDVFYYDYIDESETSTLNVENSNIILQNIVITRPISTRYQFGFITVPIKFKNSNVEILNCNITGFIEIQGNVSIQNSTISGNTWYSATPYTGRNLFNPALKIGPANDVSVVIENSIITSNSTSGFINLHLDRLDNSQIFLKNSTFVGGTFDIVYGSTPGNINGTDAVQVTNCMNSSVTINSATFQGGEGYDAQGHRHQEFLGGGNGGNGLTIINSDIMINKEDNNSHFTGGDGGNGGVYTHPYPPYNDLLNAGNGGNGISVIQSTINVLYPFFEPMELTPGLGGEGDEYQGRVALPGGSGKDLLIDTLSTINYLTSINDWMLMQ